MELKIKFVQLTDQPDVNRSQLCRCYGICHPAGYKWSCLNILRYFEAAMLPEISNRTQVFDPK